MYQVLLTRQSQKDLKKIKRDDRQLFEALVHAIQNLAENPYPVGAVSLEGREGYRVRVRNYRILYSVNKAELLVEVFRVGPRGDIYKK